MSRPGDLPGSMRFEAVFQGPFALRFLFLIEEVKIKLRYLKLADIAIGIDAGDKFNMIFHNRVLYPTRSRGWAIKKIMQG